MKQGMKEFWVGLFVICGFAAILMLSFRVGNLGGSDSSEGYQVTAKFEYIGGLTAKAPVRMSGVTIGRVLSIEIEPTDYTAKVSMQIFPEHRNLPADTSASILTSGLLGSQYVGLEPGGDDEYLAQGSQIELTQSAMVLEKLIGRFFLNQTEK